MPRPDVIDAERGPRVDRATLRDRARRAAAVNVTLPEPDADGIERVDWPEFDASFRWNPGEHITIIGPTGQGKTTLALELLGRRRFVVVIAAKPRDKVLERLERRSGYVRINKWPKRLVLDPERPCRILFWPEIRTVRELPAIRPRYADALDNIFRQGGWTVYVDEGVFSSAPQFLNLRHRLEDYWQRGRSSNLSLMFSAQRSSNVPLLAYDQVEHLFAFRENDRRNAERIGEMAGQDRLLVRDVVQGLPRHHALYVGTRTDRLAITKAPHPGKGK